MNDVRYGQEIIPGQRLPRAVCVVVDKRASGPSVSGWITQGTYFPLLPCAVYSFHGEDITSAGFLALGGSFVHPILVSLSAIDFRSSLSASISLPVLCSFFGHAVRLSPAFHLDELANIFLWVNQPGE